VTCNKLLLMETLTVTGAYLSSLVRPSRTTQSDQSRQCCTSCCAGESCSIGCREKCSSESDELTAVLLKHITRMNIKFVFVFTLNPKLIIIINYTSQTTCECMSDAGEFTIVSVIGGRIVDTALT